MPDLYSQLIGTTDNLAKRRTPNRWISQHPHLAAFARLGELVDAIRSSQPDPAGSDQAIRILCQLAPTHPDAHTVLLGALAPRLRRSIPGPRSLEYRTDVLTELACVLLEPGPLDHLDRLERRLINRARTRTSKRYARLRDRHDHEITHPALETTPSAGTPVDTEAVDRVQLSEFRHAINRAIDNGDLPAQLWCNFRDNRLRHELVADQARTHRERQATYRAARAIDRVVTSQLAADHTT